MYFSTSSSGLWKSQPNVLKRSNSWRSTSSITIFNWNTPNLLTNFYDSLINVYYIVNNTYLSVNRITFLKSRNPMGNCKSAWIYWSHTIQLESILFFAFNSCYIEMNKIVVHRFTWQVRYIERSSLQDTQLLINCHRFIAEETR